MTANPYRVERLESTGEILARVTRAPGSPSAFQTVSWLKGIYQELAPPFGGKPLGLEVCDRTSGDMAMILPLVLVREHGLTIAEFPGFGVSDYKKPILGPSAPKTPAASLAALRAVTSCLHEVDLVRFTSMQEHCGDEANPLVIAGGTHISRLKGNRLTIEGSFEAYLRSRGKKYRSDVERCYRLLDKAGVPQFKRATSTEGILETYKVLEEQQRRRHAELGGNYVLDEAPYSTFYRSLLLEGGADDFAQIFSLSVNGDVIATLYGVETHGCVTVLRFATGDKRWSNLAPGRLILMSTLRYFIDRGIRTFDFGIGDYPFKDGFGFKAYPLHDRLIALSWRARPYVALSNAKLRIRAQPRLRALADRLRGKG